MKEEKVFEEIQKSRKLVQIICASGSATVVPAHESCVEVGALEGGIKEGGMAEVTFLLPGRVAEAICRRAGTIFFVEVSESNLAEAKKILDAVERHKSSGLVNADGDPFFNQRSFG